MVRETVDFNRGWFFHPGGELSPEVLSYGNKGLTGGETCHWQKADNHGLTRPENPHVDSWRKLDLPHDFVIEGKFTPASSPYNGSLAHAKAWYLKKFELPASDSGKRIHIEFDGVYRDCQVWMNGMFIGRHLSGYTSFGFDLTESCRFGHLNSIAVLVDATENELWSYEGGGIYRAVRLLKTSPVHVPQWGVFVRTGTDAGRSGDVSLDISVSNMSRENCTIEVSCSIMAPDGTRAMVIEPSSVSVPSFDRRTVAMSGRIGSPGLWSIESPQLYKALIELRIDGDLVDRYVQSFGFRFFHFDPATGFYLNGSNFKLKGVCCHQDHAGVGVAVPPALQEWRVRHLKEMGCNAIRTSHNPPDPALLDACDRVGMLVMDEHRLAGASAEILGQLESLVLRDRNHPSVILWSLGNEEMGIQGKEAGVDIFRRMQEVAHRMDPGRPCTYAMNCDWHSMTDFHNSRGFRFDVFGANYRSDQNSARYDQFHAKYPDWPMLGSETWGGGATRGLYEPDKSDIPIMYWEEEKSRMFASAYGNWSTPWGYSIEECWQDCANRPFMAGTFVWTGFDYRGEPTPYLWPAVISRFGVLDHCGFYKEVAHYLRAWWRPGQPHIFLMPHWNWEGRDGQPVVVRCYANTPAVELFLNGRSLGRKEMPVNSRLEWNVPYFPGELKAVGSDAGGNVLVSVCRRTASAPAGIALRCDVTASPDGDAVAIVEASIVDTDGNPCPRADNTVEFELAGEGIRLIGVGNGNPVSHEPDKFTNRRKAYHGLCQAIFAGKHSSVASATVKASSQGLRGAGSRLR